MLFLICSTVDVVHFNKTYDLYHEYCLLADGHKMQLKEYFKNVTEDARDRILNCILKNITAKEVTEIIYDKKIFRDIEDIPQKNGSDEALFYMLNDKYIQCLRIDSLLNPINLLFNQITGIIKT